MKSLKEMLKDLDIYMANLKSLPVKQVISKSWETVAMVDAHYYLTENWEPTDIEIKILVNNAKNKTINKILGRYKYDTECIY